MAPLFSLSTPISLLLTPQFAEEIDYITYQRWRHCSLSAHQSLSPPHATVYRRDWLYNLLGRAPLFSLSTPISLLLTPQFAEEIDYITYQRWRHCSLSAHPSLSPPHATLCRTDVRPSFRPCLSTWSHGAWSWSSHTDPVHIPTPGYACS